MAATPAPTDAENTLGQVADALANQHFTWEKMAAVAALAVGCVVVIKVILALANRAMKRSKLEKGAHAFLSSGLRVVLWLVAICIVLGYLGVPMTSLVALLSVLGLAISLSIQGILSNLAGGILLLTSKPFAAGDYVEAGSVSGTVTEVGLVYTKMTTVDNKLVCVPNGQIAGQTIVNYTAQDKRQVELKFSVAYGAPQDVVKGCIAQVVGAHPKAMFTPEPLIRVSGYKESSVEYILRVWCATGDYWPLHYDLLEQVKAAFDKAGVEMTYNHLNVHLMKEKED